jgi:hypothetical protein
MIHTNTGGQASQEGDNIVHYFNLGLTPIPLKPRTKQALVRWRDSEWNPKGVHDLKPWIDRAGTNWGLRCGPELHVIDIDDPQRFEALVSSGAIPRECPVVGSSRGGHIWFKPKEPVHSRNFPRMELKGVGSYIVAPPSIHPSGWQYQFLTAPNGSLPECEVGELLNRLGCNVQTGDVSEETLGPAAPRCDISKEGTLQRATGWGWLDNALQVSGLDAQLSDGGPDTVLNRELLQLWHQGVPEGRRWLTLNALLRAARLDG